MIRDYRRELLRIYKTEVGTCLTNLRELKGKTDPRSKSDGNAYRAILGVNVRRLAHFRKENPDITGPRCKQLSLAL